MSRFPGVFFGQTRHERDITMCWQGSGSEELGGNTSPVHVLVSASPKGSNDEHLKLPNPSKQEAECFALLPTQLSIFVCLTSMLFVTSGS